MSLIPIESFFFQPWSGFKIFHCAQTAKKFHDNSCPAPLKLILKNGDFYERLKKGTRITNFAELYIYVEFYFEIARSLSIDSVNRYKSLKNFIFENIRMSTKLCPQFIGVIVDHERRMIGKCNQSIEINVEIIRFWAIGLFCAPNSRHLRSQFHQNLHHFLQNDLLILALLCFLI